MGLVQALADRLEFRVRREGVRRADAAHALWEEERWRIDELERAGYDGRAARTLAARHDVDLHRAVDLLRNGCSLELALKILL
jgi:hypothetical protein